MYLVCWGMVRAGWIEQLQFGDTEKVQVFCWIQALCLRQATEYMYAGWVSRAHTGMRKIHPQQSTAHSAQRALLLLPLPSLLVQLTLGTRGQRCCIKTGASPCWLLGLSTLLHGGRSLPGQGMGTCPLAPAHTLPATGARPRRSRPPAAASRCLLLSCPIQQPQG